MKCENCGNEHDGSYGSGRFCSDHCRRVYAGKRVNINGKQRCNFKGKPKALYGTWKCECCDLIFETRRKLQEHNHKFHPVPEGCIWNKGLTEINDKRIANAIKKLKQKYKAGIIVTFIKGKKHSKETKRKIRLSTIKYLQKIKQVYQPRYNVKSIPVLEQIAKAHGWTIQHAENGGEFYTGIGYWLDAYDKENNLAPAYAELNHYIDIKNNILREKDIKRQNEIIEYLHCEFWRYNEKTKCLWKVN